MTAPDERRQTLVALRQVPGFETYSGPIERLGGLTNRVYRAGDVVLRLPGEGTEEIINRAHEAEMAVIAAKAGVAPDVIHADANSGVMVTRHVDAITMTPEGFKRRARAPARAGEALRKLHASGGVFPFRFGLFAMIDQYLGVLATKDVALPSGYHDVVAQAQAIRVALDKHPVALVPCHCDPLCENFLDTGTRMWIVDWEYAGMNDPMWDLGDLSVEGEFDAAQDAEMMHTYFGTEPSAFDTGRMVIYKAMCDLLWTLWGLIQHANKNPADDFSAYANRRFARCKALMAEAPFARHVASVAAGP
jgi:thiamine kinase-like enzyme